MPSVDHVVCGCDCILAVGRRIAGYATDLGASRDRHRSTPRQRAAERAVRPAARNSLPRCDRMSSSWQQVGARRWLGVAVGSLVLAGALASPRVGGRAPGLDRLFSDPMFFRRALVVHVDLSLVVWFLSFVAALYYLIPTRRHAPWRGALRLGAAIARIAMMVLAAA